MFRSMSHCRYSGKSVPRNEAEDNVISGVKMSKDVKSKFKKLQVVTNGTIDSDDIMFANNVHWHSDSNVAIRSI